MNAWVRLVRVVGGLKGCVNANCIGRFRRVVIYVLNGLKQSMQMLLPGVHTQPVGLCAGEMRSSSLPIRARNSYISLVIWLTKNPQCNGNNNIEPWHFVWPSDNCQTFCQLSCAFYDEESVRGGN